MEETLRSGEPLFGKPRKTPRLGFTHTIFLPEWKTNPVFDSLKARIRPDAGFGIQGSVISG